MDHTGSAGQPSELDDQSAILGHLHPPLKAHSNTCATSTPEAYVLRLMPLAQGLLGRNLVTASIDVMNIERRVRMQKERTRPAYACELVHMFHRSIGACHPRFSSAAPATWALKPSLIFNPLPPASNADVAGQRRRWH